MSLEQDKIELRERRAAGESIASLARLYKVARSFVRMVTRGVMR